MAAQACPIILENPSGTSLFGNIDSLNEECYHYTSSGIIIISGSPSKCIFNGRFENKTGDTAAVVGCIGSETVVNIAHNGFVSELTLRDGVTLEFIPKEDNQIEGGPRVTREIGKNSIGYRDQFVFGTLF